LTWTVTRAAGSPAELHARPLPAEVRRGVQVWDVTGPALVLGSTQPDSVVDRAACDAAGVEVVRRRSGGGAVLLEPGGAVWVDVELPRADALWVDDVGRAAWWLGERWAAALGGLGVADLQVHRGPMASSRWSRLVCFAGMAPGEVRRGAGGPKVVGIAQRRTRGGARFQCAVPRRWEPERLAGLLALAAAERVALVTALGAAVAPVPAAPGEVGDAFVDALDDAT
jgi:lipoate-protein ligase A